VNPATGKTYKDELTDQVVHLVKSEKMKLEDALNIVRNAIKGSPDYAAYQASLKKSSGGGSGSGDKPTNLTYWSDKNHDKITVALVGGVMARYNEATGEWIPLTPDELTEYEKTASLLTPGGFASLEAGDIPEADIDSSDLTIGNAKIPEYGDYMIRIGN
jgi:hypothetical protein